MVPKHVTQELHDELNRQSVKIEGLASSLLSREWGIEPTWTEFTLHSQSRSYHVVVQDMEWWRRENQLEPPAPERRFEAHVALKRRKVSKGSEFLPLRRRTYPSLDAAIVATIYATLRHGDWSAQEWQRELVVAQQQKQEQDALDELDFDLMYYVGRIRSWLDFLQRSPQQEAGMRGSE